jgi:hypothetical protein
VGAQIALRQVQNTLEICEIHHKNNLRHADTQIEIVSSLVYNSDIKQTKGK